MRRLKILGALFHLLDAKYKLIKLQSISQKYPNGSWHPTTGTAQLISGNIDFFVPQITPTYERSLAFAVTPPLFVSKGNCFMFCQAHKGPDIHGVSFLLLLPLLITFMGPGFLRKLNIEFLLRKRWFWMVLFTWNLVFARLIGKWVVADIIRSSAHLGAQPAF